LKIIDGLSLTVGFVITPCVHFSRQYVV